ncbi:hypothetical protein BJ956_002406 [Arthrobacter psychrochitiniphilus]|nr:hypothetical protein [Arthrobacter psychrochitiniphilus]
MSAETKTRLSLSQTEYPYIRSPKNLQATAVRVVVRDAGIEIHGYAVAREGNHVSIVWTVASGRHRQRTFSADNVFLSGFGHGWDGYPIPFENLAALRPAAH